MNNFARWTGCLLWALLTVAVSATARPIGEYSLAYLDMSTGLPANFVDDIYEDSQGFVWICTQGGGLARYDGYGYRYMYAGGQGLSMRSNSCRNVVEDAYKRLWVSFDECTQVIDLRTMTIIVPPTKTPQLGQRLERALNEPGMRNYLDSKGVLWIATKRYIRRLLMDEQGVITGIEECPVTSNTPDIALCDVNGDGSVWTHYDAKLWQITPRGGKLLARNLSSLYPETTGRFVTCILRFGGVTWFASNEGLFCSDGRRWDASSGLLHSFVNTLAVAPDGRLMIGTLGGISLLDVRHGGHITQWNTLSPVNRLSSNFVNCVFCKHGQIWVGTESGGIVKLSPRQLELVNYTHQDSQPGSLSRNAVNAMYVEPDGTLWVGTVEGGLNRKEPGSGLFTHYTAQNSGLSHNSVAALAADKKGGLWIGTWAQGVNYMPLNRPGEITPLAMDETYRRLTRFVGALAYDSINDGLWIGTNDGLFFYDFRGRRMMDPFEGCREIRGCIGSLVTKDGELWMGCLEGVVRVNLKRKVKGKFDWKHYRTKLDDPKSGVQEKITAFCQTADGTLWLGSGGYGLYRMEREKGGEPRFHNITINHGLANNMVRGIVADQRGLLWITTENGLSVYNTKTGAITNYGEDDGLACAQFYYNSAAISPNGTIYLGSEQGLTEVKGIDIKGIGHGKLTFTRLIVDNQEVNAGKYLDQDISIAKRVNLGESNRSFTIDFSALNYGSEMHGTYSYRMKGFEEEWTQLPSGEHSVRYTALPSGDYEFEVKYNCGLSDEEQYASIGVHVSPYFWKSWWFLTLLAMALIALGTYLYKRRLEIIRQREVQKLYTPIQAALMESDAPDKLQLRIKSILDNQKLFTQSRDKIAEEDRKDVARKIKPFMEVLMKVMEANYDNSEFGVQELASAMNMSRATLNKKLYAEAGTSVSQFMRNYRLSVAKKMLEDNTANRHVSEIAYRVGFNDPKYFTRCFTKEYGFSPSSYKV